MNINDVVIYEENHFLKARLIIKNLPETNTILIGGFSGTGKPEIALILARVFHSAEVFSIDQFYKVPAYRTFLSLNLDRETGRFCEFSKPH